MRRGVVVSPKKPHEYKAACHVLMEEIFTSPGLAYAWLHRQFGKPIHFSQIDDIPMLHAIWERLYMHSFKVEL